MPAFPEAPPGDAPLADAGDAREGAVRQLPDAPPGEAPLADAVRSAFAASGRSIASLFLLGECNLSCRFCGAADGYRTIAYDDAVAIVRGLAAARVSSVVFGGGEPTLWPGDLAGLGREARSRGLTVQLCTNGLALADGQLADDAVDRVILPLESAVAAEHDLRRGLRGHQALVRRRLVELAARGLEATISTVVDSGNADQLAGLADLLADHVRRGLRLHAWHLYRFIPVGRHGAGRDALAPSSPAWRAALRSARSTSPCRVVVRPDFRRSRCVGYVWLDAHGLRLAP